MLDLDARVHLEEVEKPIARWSAVKQEFDRSRPDVADRRGGLDRRGAHRLAQRGRHRRRRRLLDHLLMAALDRAVALAEMDDRALLVAEHLHFDMARSEQRPLDQQAAVAEGVFRLGARRPQSALQRLGRAHDAHAAAAAARARLDHHGITDARGLFGEACRRLVRPMIARDAGHAGRRHPRLGRALVAHGADGGRRRSDEREPGGGAGLGEIGVLGEKAVARVKRFGAGRLRRVDQRADRQIGPTRRRRTDADGLVSQAHMQRRGVGVAKDGDRAQTLFARGPDDPASDLAAVGDKNGRKPRAHRPCLAHTGARLPRKAASPSRPSAPRKAAAKLRAAVSI